MCGASLFSAQQLVLSVPNWRPELVRTVKIDFHNLEIIPDNINSDSICEQLRPDACQGMDKA